MSALSSAQRMRGREPAGEEGDRKSTRLNSSHLVISYAVFCLKKKTTPQHHIRCDRLEYRRQKQNHRTARPQPRALYNQHLDVLECDPVLLANHASATQQTRQL